MSAARVKYLKFFVIATIAAVFPMLAFADDRPDQELEFEVGPNGTSQVYQRPADAEYFWWDVEPAIQVELKFVDGSTKTVSSDDEFSKRIVSVKFINNRALPVHVLLHTRF